MLSSNVFVPFSLLNTPTYLCLPPLKRRKSIPKMDPIAAKLVKIGSQQDTIEPDDGEANSGAEPKETISLRTFDHGDKRRWRRRSSVVHEEADFHVKVESWQQKINDELGTNDQANLNRKKKIHDLDQEKDERPVLVATVVCKDAVAPAPADDDVVDGRAGVVLRRRRKKGRDPPRPVSCSVVGVIG